MQPIETESGSLVRRAGARAAVGHLYHLHSDGELAATPRRTSAARNQKSVVITTNLFSRPHRHTYGPRGAGVSRRAAYACGLSACTRPSRARMKSAEKIRDSVSSPYLPSRSSSKDGHPQRVRAAGRRKVVSRKKTRVASKRIRVASKPVSRVASKRAGPAMPVVVHTSR